MSGRWWIIYPDWDLRRNILGFGGLVELQAFDRKVELEETEWDARGGQQQIMRGCVLRVD